MAERDFVIDHMRLSYEGIFKVAELYKLIDGWLREKWYDKREKGMSERVTKDSKFVEWEMEPWKKITDHSKIVIKLRAIMTDIKEIEVQVDKKPVKMNQGKIDFVFDGFLETDYENRWESKPLFYFLRMMFDKYIFKPYTSGHYSNVIDDVNDLHARIKSFLNLYRYTDVSWSARAHIWPAH